MPRLPLPLAVLALLLTASSPQAQDTPPTPADPEAQALEAYDFAVAAGHGAIARSPLDCLRETLPVRVKVTHWDFGCMRMGSENTLYLKLERDSAVLSGWSQWPGLRLAPRALSRAEGERLLLELVSAVTRQEPPSPCASTEGYSAIIEWACSDPGETEGMLHFETRVCLDDLSAVDNLEEGPRHSRALALRRASFRAIWGARR